MAGHSKWNNIKHRKEAADQRRGKLFSKLAKLIMVAAKTGGGNPEENLSLRYAIDRARAESMPKDSIERAVKKGTGELEADDVSELTYEGIAPGGVSLIIEAVTDNRNRTGGEVRNLLEKRGASLGKTNSVQWMFNRRGVVGVPSSDASEEELFEVAIDAGAENIEEEDGVFLVYARVEDFDRVRSTLREYLLEKRKRPDRKWGEAEDDRPVFTCSELVYVPQNPVSLESDKTRQALDLIGDLEDHDDVQTVFSNLEISDELLAELAAD